MRKLMRKWSEKRFCILWKLVMLSWRSQDLWYFKRCVLGRECVEFDYGILLLILIDVSNLY